MMKLYNRDYTELTESEIEKLLSLRQEEVVGKLGNLEIRRCKFHEYPKAARHFLTLFPNNYLDIVELKDKKRLKSQLEQFFHLINSDEVTERKILNFINNECAYFIIGSILKQYFHFGHHDAFLFPEFQLGNSHQVDYLLVGRSSDGWHFVFIELESPVGNITIASGDLGAVIRKGLAQVSDWDAWLQARYSSLVETFNKYRGRERLPDEFFTLDKSRIYYVVVAGRRTDFKDKTYRIRRTMKNKDTILILHYDNILDAAANVIGERTY